MTNNCLSHRVVGRRAMEPIDIGGWHIPEGVCVLADVWSIHYDKDVWGPQDPNIFEPDRCDKIDLIEF